MPGHSDVMLAPHHALFDDEKLERVRLRGRKYHFIFRKVAECQFLRHPQHVLTRHLVKWRELAQVINGGLNQ